jgi:hypothetical protein
VGSLATHRSVNFFNRLKILGLNPCKIMPFARSTCPFMRGVRHGSPVNADVVVVTEFEEFLPRELRTVIRDDGAWDSKAVDNVDEKFHGLLRSDRRDRPRLNPLCELVNGDMQMRVAPGCFLERPDQIEPPDCERPRDGDHLEHLRW